jgi:hypothetical protein
VLRAEEAVRVARSRECMRPSAAHASQPIRTV